MGPNRWTTSFASRDWEGSCRKMDDFSAFMGMQGCEYAFECYDRCAMGRRIRLPRGLRQR